MTQKRSPGKRRIVWAVMLLPLSGREGRGEVAYLYKSSSLTQLPRTTLVNASQSARAWIRLAVFLKVRRRLPSPDQR
jgi:hypothetical protein